MRALAARALVSSKKGGKKARNPFEHAHEHFPLILKQSLNVRKFINATCHRISRQEHRLFKVMSSFT